MVSYPRVCFQLCCHLPRVCFFQWWTVLPDNSLAEKHAPSTDENCALQALIGRLHRSKQSFVFAVWLNMAELFCRNLSSIHLLHQSAVAWRLGQMTRMGWMMNCWMTNGWHAWLKDQIGWDGDSDQHVSVSTSWLLSVKFTGFTNNKLEIFTGMLDLWTPEVTFTDSEHLR